MVILLILLIFYVFSSYFCCVMRSFLRYYVGRPSYLHHFINRIIILKGISHLMNRDIRNLHLNHYLIVIILKSHHFIIDRWRVVSSIWVIFLRIILIFLFCWGVIIGYENCILMWSKYRVHLAFWLQFIFWIIHQTKSYYWLFCIFYLGLPIILVVSWHNHDLIVQYNRHRWVYPIIIYVAWVVYKVKIEFFCLSYRRCLKIMVDRSYFISYFSPIKKQMRYGEEVVR